MAGSVERASPRKAQRTKPIPVEELMFAFRTISSNGGTKEFLEECSAKGYSVRITSGFFDFVLEQAMAAAARSASTTIASTNFNTVVAAKDWNDCRRKKKRFFG